MLSSYTAPPTFFLFHLIARRKHIKMKRDTYIYTPGEKQKRKSEKNVSSDPCSYFP
jgi:hypothetical protein